MDPWSDDVFGHLAIQPVVEKTPYTPRQVTSLGLFEPDNIETDTFFIDVANSVVRLTPFTDRHAVPDERDLERDDSVPFRCGAFRLHAPMAKDEILRLRRLGTKGRESLMARRDRKLQTLRRDLDASMELLYCSAIGGIVRAKNGNVLNLFTRFEITQPDPLYFDLANKDEGALLDFCEDAQRIIRDNLGGIVPTGYHAICGRSFFKKFRMNAEVRESYKDYVNIGRLRGENFKVFTAFHWGGIDWEEYQGGVDGVDFVESTQCRIFPKGVPGMYRVPFAPAPSNPEELGRPVYAFANEEPRKKEFIDMWVENYPMAVNTRPNAVLVGHEGEEP